MEEEPRSRVAGRKVRLGEGGRETRARAAEPRLLAKVPAAPEASRPKIWKTSEPTGIHDDFYDDAIVVQNYSCLFKLHPGRQDPF